MRSREIFYRGKDVNSDGEGGEDTWDEHAVDGFNRQPALAVGARYERAYNNGNSIDNGDC